MEMPADKIIFHCVFLKIGREESKELRKQVKCESCFLNFYSDLDLSTALDFSFSET